MPKYLIIFLLAISLSSQGTEVDIASEIISTRFPAYRLAVERDFQTDVIYGEWGKDKSISFLPQAADFNRDAIQDWVFAAVGKAPGNSIKINDRQFEQRPVLLLACHGTAAADFNCFTLIDKEMIYPLSWFYSAVTMRKTVCPYNAQSFVEGPAISVEPALGNIYDIYWFTGKTYQSCSFGD